VSPDGRWIAATEGPESQAQIVKIPLDGGDSIRLVPGYGPAWSPDGRRLAFVSTRSGSRRVWVTDTDGQRAIELKDAEVSNPLVVWLPDGRLAWHTPDARNYRIRDLKSGRDELLVKDASVGYVFAPKFSPKGDRVAVVWNRRLHGQGLWLLSWPAREERFLTSEGPAPWPIGWSADGEWIYATPMSGGRTLLRVSAGSGKVERLGSFPTDRLQQPCALTPDRAAIICSLSELKADAWLVDHFDPEIP
jgi:Tol biopolymer transport system component